MNAWATEIGKFFSVAAHPRRPHLRAQKKAVLLWAKIWPAAARLRVLTRTPK
jgi:hypothetical protein